MRKKPAPESGFSSPRVFFAFILCFVGGLLGLIGGAAPPPLSKSTASPAAFAPIVKTSVAHGTSGSVRNLPSASSVARTFVERELPPVKPTRDVPSSFIA
jgi:hypothetical protein